MVAGHFVKRVIHSLSGLFPIWEEIQITFTAGHTPRQLFSDDEIADAVASCEITLTLTGEVYWCPIVGKKPAH